jgi:transglutaminase-like putative cysteine protease
VLAPGQFELLKYKGDMQSWKNIGLFIYKLNEGRDVLPEDKKATVKSLIEGEQDTYNKVQKLYAYMQQSTRYVANEYGIAGWQTFDAMNVATNGYGDCKGLTNYLKALLKEAGINSYVTLVYAGEDYYKIDEDFPANTFNHVILCVPQPKDTIWVECTSQQLPAGYLGSFTQGRKVLLTSEQGGFLCMTPSYDKSKNFIIRNQLYSWIMIAGNKK